MRCAHLAKLKVLTTATAACAWLAVCVYLSAWWPSLAAVLDVHLPRTTPLALGIAATAALGAKDCWLRASPALLVDALLAAPPLIAIGFFFHPFLVTVE